MVRVHQPPGGETKLTSDTTTPEHHAVRVLKPPGGGSSISFGEDSDDYMKPKAKPTPAEEVPKEDPEQAPKLETNAGNPVSSETPETKTTEQPQLQQKQRIPPGGFSTKLW